MEVLSNHQTLSHNVISPCEIHQKSHIEHFHPISLAGKPKIMINQEMVGADPSYNCYRFCDRDVF